MSDLILSLPASVAGGGDASGGPTPSQPPTQTIPESNSWLANLIPQVIQFIGSLGGLVKQGTKHASYDQVNPLAANFAETTYAQIVSTYGEQSAMQLGPFLSQLLIKEMDDWWGLGASLNAQIKKDAQVNANDTKRMLWLFFLWVFTNVDKDSGADTNGRIFNGLFTIIVLGALQQNQLDTTKLVRYQSPIIGGGTVPQPQITTHTSFASIGFVAGALLLLVLIFTKKKGAT